MKYLIHFLIILALSLFTASFLPWWGFVIIAFVVSALLQLKEGPAFLSGFMALFVLWLVQTFLLNQANQGILSSKMGALFGGLSPILMILITAIIGGLLAGLGSWSGVLARQMVLKK